LKLCPRLHLPFWAAKFVNCFDRRQHLFGRNTHWSRCEYSVASGSLVIVPILPKMQSFNLFLVCDYLPRISSKSVPYSCEAKEILMARGRSRRDIRRQCHGQSTNIMPPLQHRLRRQNNIVTAIKSWRHPYFTFASYHRCCEHNGR